MITEITVISDNTASETLSGEWGLSLLVKYNGKNILVDAGASNLFLKNMEGLGENVADVDFAVLSHAHYDHANGMPAFFKHNAKAKLYLRETTAADCYAKKGFFRKYIGIPKRMIKAFPDRIEMVQGNYKLYEGAYLIPHTTKGLSALGEREKMYRKLKTGWQPDDFSHEQSLVLETDKGLLIINSCSHGGVINTINEVREALPGKPVYGYIGGFHLFNKTDEEVLQVANALKETSIDYVCTGHCTKERAYDILRQQLGEKVEKLHVGLKITI